MIFETGQSTFMVFAKVSILDKKPYSAGAVTRPFNPKRPSLQTFAQTFRPFCPRLNSECEFLTRLEELSWSLRTAFVLVKFAKVCRAFKLPTKRAFVKRLTQDDLHTSLKLGQCEFSRQEMQRQLA